MYIMKEDSEKLKKSIKTIIIYIWFISGVFGLVYGVFVVSTGLHNIDLGYNMAVLNAKYDLNLQDTNNLFQVWDEKTVYITGHNQVLAGLLIALVGSWFLGMIYAGYKPTCEHKGCNR